MTKEEAVEAAHEIAKQRSWPWVGPVRVHTKRDYLFFGRRCLEVWTNADCRGQNVYVMFEARSGEVISANWLTR